jgi:hypothetical protein
MKAMKNPAQSRQQASAHFHVADAGFECVAAEFRS